MRLRINGILATSSGFLGGKQWIKFANTSFRGRVCLFYQNELTIYGSFEMYSSSFDKFYVAIVHAERTSTVAIAFK